MISLDTLPDGTTARMVSIGGERAFRRRLMELGLLPGTELRVIRRAAVGGILELEVRRSRLSLRLAEVDRLLVTTD